MNLFPESKPVDSAKKIQQRNMGEVHHKPLKMRGEVRMRLLFLCTL